MPSQEERVQLFVAVLALTFCSSCWGIRAAEPLFAVLRGSLQDYSQQLTYMLVLAFGKLLRMKKQSVVHAIGFQTIILSCLLPALLFRAVTEMPVEGLEPATALIPVAYISFLQVGYRLIAFATGFTRLDAERRTLCMMFCSLAPGLSSLPFVQAVVEAIPPHLVGVGHVGIADLGVKFTILFIGYFLAAYQASCELSRKRSALRTAAAPGAGAGTGARLRSGCHVVLNLVCGYFAEPVNVSSMVAVTLLAVGPVRLDQQWIMGRCVKYLAGTCTPAIFLLIGVKLQPLKANQLGLLMLVVARSGLAMIFVALLQLALGLDAAYTMFWVIFCNSAVSFWPYTHIVHFSSEEKNAMTPVLSAFLAEAGATLSGELDHVHEDVKDELRAVGEKLSSIAERLDGGDATFDAGVFQARQALAKAGGKDPAARKAAETLASDFSPAFDMSLALLFISVSFSWTIAICTVVSFVPYEVWMTSWALPAAGTALTLAGCAPLWLQGRRLARAAAEEAAEEAAGRKAQEDGGEGSERLEEEADVAAMPARQRRGSICGQVDLDELAVAEADTEVRRAANARMSGRAKAEDEAGFAMLSNVAELATVDVKDSNAMMRRGSLVMFMPGTAPLDDFQAPMEAAGGAGQPEAEKRDSKRSSASSEGSWSSMFGESRHKK